MVMQPASILHTFFLDAIGLYNSHTVAHISKDAYQRIENHTVTIIFVRRDLYNHMVVQVVRDVLKVWNTRLCVGKSYAPAEPSQESFAPCVAQQI